MNMKVCIHAVTGIGYIKGHNVVRRTKDLCMNTSKGSHMYMSQS